MNGSKKISWEALDHIQEEKSADWFWIVGIISAGIAILAIYFGNILFALLILLAIFTSFMATHIPPKIVRYEINRKGVIVGDILYPYSNLKSFFVIDEDGYDRDRLILKSTKALMPYIILPLGSDVLPDEIREYLLEYLDEEEMYEPWGERFMSGLGF